MNIHDLRHDPDGEYYIDDRTSDDCHAGDTVTDHYGMLSAAHTYLEQRGHPVTKPLSSRLIAATAEEEEHLLVHYGSAHLFVYRYSDVYPTPQEVPTCP